MPKILLYIGLFICNLNLCAQDSTFVKIQNKFIDNIEFRNASIGMYAENLNTGTIILNKNAETSLIPASILKIYTTSIALDIFGKDHTFETKLAYSGNIDKTGTLNGNLYIIGNGDPCFGSKNFENNYANENINDWCNAIKSLGINKISGDIISNISYFKEITIPNKWIWEDLANYYGSEGSSLNINDNIYQIVFNTFENNMPAKVVGIEPNDLNIKVINKVISTTKTNGDNTIIYKGNNENEVIIKGTLPCNKVNYKVKGSIPNPAKYIADRLLTNLKNSGIDVLGISTISDTEIKDSITIFRKIKSPTLLEIIKYTNLHSFNLYAEILGHHVEKVNGKPYKYAAKDFLQEKGIDTNGFNIEDACGLSHYNVITPKQTFELLKYIYKSDNRNNFIESLPIAGEIGTLKSYKCCKPPQKLVAKTGSISKVRSIAGYINNAQGDTIAICLIINNYNCSSSRIKALIEDLANDISIN